MTHRPYDGNANPKWRGGRIKVSGYIYIYSPNHPNKTKDKYVAEHRLVLENKFGRFLQRNEEVHHINGIRDDNRLENLIVLTHLQHSHIHKLGKKQTPEHIAKRFKNRKKANMSKFIRDKNGRFIGIHNFSISSINSQS